MNKRIVYGLLTILVCVCSLPQVVARKIHDKYYKFKVVVPATMAEIDDSFNSVHDVLYCDTTAHIIMMISGREGKFKSVNDYIDCKKEELEHQLQSNYGDSTLRLISCNKSKYYPDKMVALHFQVSVLPFGYNTYFIYFIHHRDKEIQISFTYKKDLEKVSLNYIDDIVKTLKLK